MPYICNELRLVIKQLPHINKAHVNIIGNVDCNSV